jgi:hypothetical protein
MTITTITAGAAGASAMTRPSRATPADWHRRQRELVAASLIAMPSAKRSTHRRWA